VDIRLDRDSEIPLGVQLAWHLKARIVQGELEAGARLPSVREMAADSAVNANTVRAVYARLEAEGLLVTEHGRGTFVAAEAQTGAELAAIADRAARDAVAAGLDPRAVAATLFVGRGGSPGDVPEAERRRALRAEIAALERQLASPRVQRVLAAQAEDPLVAPPPAPRGRLLSVVELEAQRDELRDRLSLLLTSPDPGEEPARATDERQHSTAPNVKVTLAAGAPQWRLGHT
jgi:DNA-binding transcriptional regulator YhcF (GntR family)